MVTTKLNLSMTEPSVRQIYAKQGDTGRVLDITLDQTPEDGTLRILRPDGVEVTSDAVTGGEVESGGTFESLTEADVTELTVGIEPVQDLNGYDKPWVGGAGKNLYDGSLIRFNADPSATSLNGITLTKNADGSFRVSGTASAETRLNVNYADSFAVASYAISVRGITGSGLRIILQGNPASAGIYYTSVYLTSDWSQVYSVTESTTFNYFYLDVQNGATIDFTLKVQIEKGSTATAWQPYSNICPITGHDEVTVTDEGTNLLNYDAWKTVGIMRGTAIFENNGVTLTATDADCYTGYRTDQFPQEAMVEVTEGETITLAWDATPTNIGTVIIFPNAQTSGMVVAASNTGHLSYTVASGVTYLTFRFGVSNSGVTASYKNIQIVRGTTVPTWTPYVEPHTYTTSLGQTVYGGTLDMVTGVLTVDSRYLTVDDFTGWGGSAVSAGGLHWVNVPQTYPAGVNDDTGTNVCSHAPYTSIGSVQWQSKTPIYCVFESSMYRARMYVASASLADFKTEYATLQAVYKLAEPQTYQLTPQQIKTLVGTNNVWASSGDIVNITFTYGGLFSELPSDATSVVGKCYCDVEQNGVSSMPFTLNVKKNERES